MQIERFNLDNTSAGVDELAVASNQEYLDTAASASQESGVSVVILGEGLDVEIRHPHDQPAGVFHAFAREGVILKHNLQL